MKRKDVLKKFINILPDNSFVIFIGKSLCEEAYLYDNENYLYLLNNNMLSLAIGIANSIPENTKLFVIFEDNVLLEDIGSFFQIFLSNCVNLFLVFMYDRVGFFNQVKHIQGVFFNIGIQSFAIEDYFKSSEDLKNLKRFIYEIQGPKVYSLPVEVGRRNKPLVIDKSSIFFKERFSFAINKLVGANE